MRNVGLFCGAMLVVMASLAATQAQAQAPGTATGASSSAAMAAEIQELRQALAAQQRQIAEQRARIDALAKQLESQQHHTLATVASTAPVLPTAGSTLAGVSLPEIQGQPQPQPAPEQPAAIHYKGITITPGGFIEAAGVIRNRNENASVNSASGDGNIPFSGSPNGQLSEFRFDARQSRLTFKGEGDVGSTRISGYYEVDFLGAAPTANENQSNSFNLRQRQLWGQAAFSNGLTFTGGQQWSLFTLTRKGMENLNEFLPMTINAQYVIGYDWARQPGFRVMKSFNDKVRFGFAVENSSMVLAAQSFGTAAPALVTTAGSLSLGGVPVYGFNISANATSPNGNFTLANTPGANGVSTNLAPDLVAKLTFEPGWGHFEIKGLGRFFRDRYKGASNTELGGGLGVGAILPLVKSKLDFVAEGTLGNGIGRYGSGGGSDVTFRPDGTIRPIRSYHALIGPEIHVGKKLDIYAYAGGEYYQRTAYFVASDAAVGYGLPLANNTNCNSSEQTGTTAPAGNCNGQTRAAWEVTPGFAYRFYKGPAGTLQWGVQYSYSARALWNGIGGLPAGSAGLHPDANLSQAYTNFRYFLP